MEKKRCLYCYEILDEDNVDFHPACSRKIFGTVKVPVIPYSEDEMLKLGEQVIKSQTTVTGVQPKLFPGIGKPFKKIRATAIYNSWFVGKLYSEATY